MVVSSKKKKGKQRKAAAAAAAANSGCGGGSSANNKIVAKVRSGDNKVTKKLLTQPTEAIIPLVISGGILSVVLESLNRCEDERHLIR